MKASELIAMLQRLSKELGSDLDVACQSSGCCMHGHEVKSVEAISNDDPQIDEHDRTIGASVILIRV